ncbi:MAG: hypothetical protein PUG67_00960 [Peptoniphilaceae bacterium]|nr:hypothetical protein [Peptoniphilaceae bacterium]MDY6018626.1 hypothetical protein [Anaerococcus sp.]
MKRFIYLILLVFLFTSCGNKDSEQSDSKNEVLESVKDQEQKEALESIVKHKDEGVYDYISYNTEDNSIIQEYVKGVGQGLEFTIINNNDYYFNDGKTITYANKEKNLYYQENTDKIYDDSPSEEGIYDEMSQMGLNKVEISDAYISLSYDTGSIEKYDRKTLDLIENEFTGEGKKILKKLESKDMDVKASYDKNIKIIEGMNKAKTVGEVTGNE